MNVDCVAEDSPFREGDLFRGAGNGVANTTMPGFPFFLTSCVR
jgi:hypothetical protein